MAKKKQTMGEWLQDKQDLLQSVVSHDLLVTWGNGEPFKISFSKGGTLYTTKHFGNFNGYIQGLVDAKQNYF